MTTKTHNEQVEVSAERWVFKSLVVPSLAAMSMIVLSMAAFWMVEARHYITQDKVDQIFDNKSAVIIYRINEQKENNEKLVNSMEDLKDAVMDLKLTIANLNNQIGKEKEMNNGTN